MFLHWEGYLVQFSLDTLGGLMIGTWKIYLIGSSLGLSIETPLVMVIMNKLVYRI